MSSFKIVSMVGKNQIPVLLDRLLEKLRVKLDQQVKGAFTISAVELTQIESIFFKDDRFRSAEDYPVLDHHKVAEFSSVLATLAIQIKAAPEKFPRWKGINLDELQKQSTQISETLGHQRPPFSASEVDDQEEVKEGQSVSLLISTSKFESKTQKEIESLDGIQDLREWQAAHFKLHNLEQKYVHSKSDKLPTTFQELLMHKHWEAYITIFAHQVYLQFMHDYFSDFADRGKILTMYSGGSAANASKSDVDKFYERLKKLFAETHIQASTPKMQRRKIAPMQPAEKEPKTASPKLLERWAYLAKRLKQFGCDIGVTLVHLQTAPSSHKFARKISQMNLLRDPGQVSRAEYRRHSFSTHIPAPRMASALFSLTQKGSQMSSRESSLNCPDLLYLYEVCANIDQAKAAVSMPTRDFLPRPNLDWPLLTQIFPGITIDHPSSHEAWEA